MAGARRITIRVVRLLLVVAPALSGRAGQFVALATLALVLSPAGYGRFVAMQTLLLGVASVLGSTTSAMTNAAAARTTQRRSTDLLPLVRVLVLARWRTFLVNACCAAVVLPIGVAALGLGLRSDEIVALIVLGALSGVLPVAEGITAVVVGRGKPLVGSVVDAGRAVGSSAGAFVGAVVLGPIGGVAGMLVLDVVGVLGVLVALRVMPRPTGSDVLVVDREHDHDLRSGGVVAGISANVLGQIANWAVLWGISAVGGAVGLGVYGVASRFASVTTVAPVVLGRAVVGELAAPRPGQNHWTARSYVTVVTVLSVVSSAAALALLVFVFPGLVRSYDGLVAVTVAVLVAACLRAVLISVGNVCVARRRWGTWVSADVAAMLTVLGGLVVCAATGGDVVQIVVVAAAGSAVGVAVRLVGLARPARRAAGTLA
ncbi:hypothetical protein ACLBWP_09240 [Microbacterium sp. M1A1_1b]